MRLSRHLAVVAVVAVTSTLVVASSDPAAAAPRKVNGGTVNTEHGVRVWRGSHPVSKVWVGHAGCCAYTVSQTVEPAPAPVYGGAGVSHRFRPLVLRHHRARRHHH
jgi:hypothetical protein